MSYTHKNVFTLEAAAAPTQTVKSEKSNLSRGFRLQTPLTTTCFFVWVFNLAVQDPKTNQLSQIAGTVIVAPMWLHRFSELQKEKGIF